MASPDEARVDAARDQSNDPQPTSPFPETLTQSSPTAEATAPEATTTPERDAEASNEPATAPSRRPRGAASFPGGPPPAAPAPADAPAPTPPPAEPAPPPRFQVTTVEPTAASFPGGPPPPADDPAPTAQARTEAPAAPAAPARPETAASPAAPADPAAPAPSGTADPAATAPSGTAAPVEAPAPAEGQVADEQGDAPAAPGDAGPRTASRRRRRGARGARTGADPAGPAEAAAADAAPAAPADGGTPAGISTDADPAGAAGTPADPAGVTSVSDPGAGGEAAEPGERPEGPAVGGSARTRARRRRRAAAKARGRTQPGEAPDQAAGTVDQPDGSPDGPAGTGGDLTAPAATAVDPAAATTARAGDLTAPTTPARAGAPEQAPPTADLDLPAAPDAQPAGRPEPGTGGRRSRRGRAAAGNGEAQAARQGNGEAAAEGDTQAGTGTRPAGERTGGRRRRGRGSRVVAVDADASAAAPAEADRPEAKEQGGGRGRQAGEERSTRLETRSRREGARQADRGRRRRPSGLTEEQKRILREEGPDKRMVVTEGAERTQIGVLEGQNLVEHYVTRKAGRSMVGNIYLGRVQNVLPGMEAAFVDIGRGRNAVLYAGEVNYNEEDLDGEAPRIERALKPGQAVLVQVTKDPIGAKGARLTAQVSLAGRYLVLQPEDNTFGISRRLPEAERSRLRDILKEVRPKGLGLIVRTAAEGASADDLRADLARLQARWETVERKAKKASPPAVIYSEPELVVRVIRDIFSPDFVELVVDGDDLYQRVEEYLTEVAPDLLPKLRKHQGRLPVFEHYRVVEQIHKALERKVWLPSGGSIVIDRTEAMTVIDVNTGKFVGKANLEETVVANNLEAADEIVRQLRLRDIGGIIIIDFIDMLFERNQQAVVDRLRAALVRDKTKSQVMEVSSLGLVQMTRKRVSGGLLDSFSETCPTCDGRGVVITHEI
jgi:ribonuclease E